MKFGIYTNLQKDKKLKATQAVISAIERAGCDIYYDTNTAEMLGISSYRDAVGCEALFVIGGDGTILRAARKYVSHGIALVGINFGYLGFMSEIGIEEIDDFINAVKKGDYSIDERMMLETKLSTVEAPLVVLNDFIITKQNRTNMIKLDLYVNDTLAENYTGDGLIISTPTGSTAYSMSAGGPIVSPNLQCMLITPICPHSMYARSIVTRSTDTIRIVCADNYGKAAISADGQKEILLRKNEAVNIKTSNIKTKFLRIGTGNFYSHLKMKLAQWNHDIR